MTSIRLFAATLRVSRWAPAWAAIAFFHAAPSKIAAAAPTVDSVVPIGTVSGSTVVDRALTLNNGGLVGGATTVTRLAWRFRDGEAIENPEPSLRPAIWNESGGIVRVFALPQGDDRSFSRGEINCLNDSGAVAGFMEIYVSDPVNNIDSLVKTARFYSDGTPGSTLREIPLPAAPSDASTSSPEIELTSTAAMNNQGVVVGGFRYRSEGGDTAFGIYRYDPVANSTEDLTPMVKLLYQEPPALVSVADINDAGKIIGFVNFSTAPFVRSFIIAGGVVADIGLPDGGTDARALAINGKDDVVVSAGGRAFIWRGGPMSALPVPDTLFPATPTWINDDGTILGGGSVAGDFNSRAFIIQEGDFHLLDSLGASLPAGAASFSNLRGINNQGQILSELRPVDFNQPLGFSAVLATLSRPATDVIWDGKEGFAFDHAENWSTGFVPGPADTVQLSEPGAKTIVFPSAELVENERLLANSASQTDIDLNGGIWRIGASVEADPIGQVRLTGASVELSNGTLEVPRASVILRNDGLANSYLGLVNGAKLRVSDAVNVGREGNSKESTLSVEGTNALVEAFALNVGDTGKGNVLVTGGGSVSAAASLYVGIDGAGTMTLTGGGTSLAVDDTGDVRVGFRQPGTMTLEEGATAGFGEGATIRIGGDDVEGQFSLVGSGTTSVGGGVHLGKSGILSVLDQSSMIVDQLDVAGGSISVRSGAGLASNEEILLAQNASVEVADGGVLSGTSVFIGDSQMTIDAGGRVVVNGIQGTTLAGGVLDVATSGRLESAAGVFIQSGRLLGRGTIVGDVNNSGGTVEPGSSPGVLTIEGDYLQESGSLVLEVGGTTPGSQHDRLVVTGDLSLAGGTVVLKFINGFAPGAGTVFEFIQVTGGFTNSPAISFVGLETGWEFSTQLDPATGKFSVTSVNQGIATSTPEPDIEVTLTSVTPASGQATTRYSGTVTGPPAAEVALETSTDLGAVDAWREIGRVTLDANGLGTFANIEDPDSGGANAGFVRIRKVP